MGLKIFDLADDIKKQIEELKNFRQILRLEKFKDEIAALRAETPIITRMNPNIASYNIKAHPDFWCDSSEKDMTLLKN